MMRTLLRSLTAPPHSRSALNREQRRANDRWRNRHCKRILGRWHSQPVIRNTEWHGGRHRVNGDGLVERDDVGGWGDDGGAWGCADAEHGAGGRDSEWAHVQ